MVRSRQDQLHAHQHGMERVVTALVAHDPDPSRTPFNRSASAVLASVLVAVIALGATAAYAAITGRTGTVELRDDNAVFIERETGARYVYHRPDDSLHPVLNYTSGLLIAGSPLARTVPVPRARLAELRLGAPMGIPGAPDSLPAARDLVGKPWTLCSAAAGAEVGTAAGDSPATAEGKGPRTVLTTGGDAAAGGRPLAAPGGGAPGEALLVAAPDGRVYLIHDDRRFLIPKVRPVLAALGWSGRAPFPVAAGWLNAVPAGPDLAPLRIPGRGAASAAVDARVGQLFRASGQGGAYQWAVALRDGVAQISEVQARILDADPATRIGAPIALSTAEFASMPPPSRKPGSWLDVQQPLPVNVPVPAEPGRAVCVTVADATHGVTGVLADAAPSDARGGTAAAAGPARGPRADRVVVPRGRGVLVEAAASPSAPPGSGTLSLITDAGLRFPLANADVLTRLGYGGVVAHRMPAELVALVPEGPALDPAEAVQTP